MKFTIQNHEVYHSSSNLDTYIRISPSSFEFCLCHLRAKGADATYSADALKEKDVIAVDGPMDASNESNVLKI